ncbi:M50 family metallopeptidase [Fictibacillus phosphorivorans]|uniref:M50 family metallopeptidase n=1 Tax=Fictibacillus phosphorivorans TaxID=1221500 RepID=UPI00204261FA|nr:M50 family metallopeptidase [Fictibacillus phosphorivorans]MCM3717006.1 M50 family metallopeptidase [Fictibacillus phosphorivorans]MCM3774445.1 M50 family metallopeptidase [Fictibacillus phosphorivorans]
MINLIIQFIRKIKVNPAFWIVIFGAIFTGHFREIIVWFFVVLIHEMGHFAGAHLFKWRISRIDLLPFGGAAVVEEHGTRPFREEIWVAVLGPLQHIWMIGLAYIFYSLGHLSQGDFAWFLLLNFTLFTFNLLPIWPLDGGKIAFALFTKWMPFKFAQQHFLYLSAFLLVAGGAWQLYQQPNHLNLWVICGFLLVAHFLEWRRRHYVFIRFLLSKLQQNPSKQMRTLIVSPTASLSEVTSLLIKGISHSIIVKGHSPYTIAEKDLLEAYFYNHSPESAIGQVFR